MRRNEDKKEGGLLLLRMQKMGMGHGIGCDAQFNSIALWCWHEPIVVVVVVDDGNGRAKQQLVA